MASRVHLKVLLPLAMLLASGAAALADSIDGNWCNNDGRRFTIRGADIVTPGGKAMQGDYNRHYFSYVVPAPEPDSGKTIFMTLRGENNVSLRVGETGGEEAWVRCAPSISRAASARVPV